MKSKIHKFKILLTAVLIMTVSGFGFAGQLPLRAATIEELQQKSANLQAEIETAEKQAAELAKKAKTLKNAIAELDIEINQAQKKIELTNTKIKQLDKELRLTETELQRQKALLAANLQALYKRGGVSTVELLVASDSFSQFIDEQEYLEQLKVGIQDSAEKVVELKHKIQKQKSEQEKLLDQQEKAKQALAATRSERSRLLAETRGQEARYRAYSANLVEKQREINRELLRLSRVVSTGGSGGYPWSNAVCVWTGKVDGPCRHPSNSALDYEWYVGSTSNRRDDWNYYYRNCTSYVAWKSAVMGLEVPGLGNGGQWAMNAWKYAELSVGTQPKKGAFAVFESVSFGHVAYVEDVSGNEVLVSEYNFVADGVYSERWIPKNQPTKYVYTPWSN